DLLEHSRDFGAVGLIHLAPDGPDMESLAVPMLKVSAELWGRTGGAERDDSFAQYSSRYDGACEKRRVRSSPSSQPAIVHRGLVAVPKAVCLCQVVMNHQGAGSTTVA